MFENLAGNQKPDIIKQTEALSVKKENGTEVDYFLFDTFEVHANIIPNGCIQDWHSHQEIEEIIVVNEGTLLLEWIDNGLMKKNVETGEIIRMNNSIHRLSNQGNSEVKCTIFRFVSPTGNQSDTIKNDKKVYSDDEVQSFLQK